MAKIKSKHNVQSASFMGQIFNVGPDGLFDVPEAAVIPLMAHGFESVDDGAEPVEVPAPVDAPAAEPEKTVMPLADALALLDPDNDDHWTKYGKPKVGAVNEISGGDYKLTDISDLAPDLTREAAAAVKAAIESAS